MPPGLPPHAASRAASAGNVRLPSAGKPCTQCARGCRLCLVPAPREETSESQSGWREFPNMISSQDGTEARLDRPPAALLAGRRALSAASSGGSAAGRPSASAAEAAAEADGPADSGGPADAGETADAGAAPAGGPAATPGAERAADRDDAAAGLAADDAAAGE
jgi:hypothetical protein